MKRFNIIRTENFEFNGINIKLQALKHIDTKEEKSIITFKSLSTTRIEFPYNCFEQGIFIKLKLYIKIIQAINMDFIKEVKKENKNIHCVPLGQCIYIEKYGNDNIKRFVVELTNKDSINNINDEEIKLYASKFNTMLFARITGDNEQYMKVKATSIKTINKSNLFIENKTDIN